MPGGNGHGKSNSGPCGGNACKPQYCSESAEETGCDQCHGGGPTVKFNKICPPNDCDHYCKGMKAKEVFKKYGDAVVKIRTEFQLTTATDPALTPPVELSYGSNLWTVYAQCDGFFVDQGVIVAPASKIFLPPNTSLAYNQWPFVADSIDAGFFQSNQQLRANRIFADVTNVNGTDHSYTYQLNILVAYVIGDLVLLYVDGDATWNQNRPCIEKCHPHLRFACSRRYRPGLPAFLIGSLSARGLFSGESINSNMALAQQTQKVVAKTIISHHRFVDDIGIAPQEMVAVQGDVGALQVGAPIINAYGHVIGYVTLDQTSAVVANDIVHLPAYNTNGYNGTNGDGVVAGPSTFFFLEIMKAMVCSFQAHNLDYIETMSSPVGDYARYYHGALGLAYTVWSGQNYMSYIDPATGRVQTRFDTANPGQYLTTPCIQGENIGIAVAGLTNDIPGTQVRGNIYLPGANVPAVSGNIASHPWVDSPLSASLNDQITHFHQLPVGNQNSTAIAPLLMLSRRKVGDTLVVKYRTAASGYQAETVQNVILVKLALFYDYPLGKYNAFPWYDVSCFGAFFARPFPQDPQVAGSNPIDATLEVPTITVI